jgi:rubrerythrin
MTVDSDLQKAIASAQTALGNYQMFAESTQDPAAKQMFQSMAQDMERHVNQLNARKDYLTNSNPLNKQG